MDLEEYARSLGVDMFGVADLELLNDHPTCPPDLFKGFCSGISIAIKLTDSVIDGLPESRDLYAHQYRVVNKILDRVSFKLSKFIENKGFRAVPIPASQVLEGKNWRSYIPHKSLARAAGLGWIGKSLLLVSERYGPRIRLGSVLTDMPMDYNEPAENKCKDCTECIEKCPVSALKDVEFCEYPEERSRNFEVNKCVDELEYLAIDPDIGSMIC